MVAGEIGAVAGVAGYDFLPDDGLRYDPIGIQLDVAYDAVQEGGLVVPVAAADAHGRQGVSFRVYGCQFLSGQVDPDVSAARGVWVAPSRAFHIYACHARARGVVLRLCPQVLLLHLLIEWGGGLYLSQKVTDAMIAHLVHGATNETVSGLLVALVEYLSVHDRRPRLAGCGNVGQQMVEDAARVDESEALAAGIAHQGLCEQKFGLAQDGIGRGALEIEIMYAREQTLQSVGVECRRGEAHIIGLGQEGQERVGLVGYAFRG